MTRGSNSCGKPTPPLPVLLREKNAQLIINAACDGQVEVKGGHDLGVVID